MQPTRNPVAPPILCLLGTLENRAAHFSKFFCHFSLALITSCYFQYKMEINTKRRRVDKSERAEVLDALVKWATSRGAVIEGFSFEVGHDGVGVTAKTSVSWGRG